MPEKDVVTPTNVAEKKYIVKIGSAPKEQIWDAEKYERNRNALLEDHGEDVEIYEVAPYNGEAVNAGDAFSVHIPGTKQAQIWDADKYARNRETLAVEDPGAEVERISPVDYWGGQRAQLDSLDSQIAELEGTTKEAQDQWNLLRYNEFEKGSDEEVAAGTKAKNLEKELDELCRKRENNPVYKRTNKAVGVYLEAMRDDTKAKTAALDEKYAPEIETSKNLFSGSREAAIAKLQMPTEYTTDSAALQAARMYYDDAIKVWNAPSRYGKESGFANFFKGLIGEAPEALSVVQLTKAIGEGAPLIEVVNKIHEHEGENVNIINLIQNEPDKLDYLSPAQKSLLNAFITKSSVDAARSNDLSLGYQAGQTAMKSLGFMADFLLTGGIGDAAAKGATKGIIKGAVKGLAKIENGTLRAITKEASKFGVGTFQSGVKTLAISGMMPSTYANVINNLTNLNDAGDVDLSGRAVTNAIGDALIENLSESAGTQVEAILGMPFRAIGTTGAGKLFANTEFGAWAKALKNAPAGRIMKQAAWNGLIGEIGEEWYGNALRVLTGVDPDALKNFATAEQQIITWASFAPMSILGGGASIAQYEVSKKQLDNAGKYLRQALANAGYDVATIDNVLAAANAENPTELAKGLAPVIVQTANDNVLQSNSVFKAVLDYAGAVSKYRTYGGFIDADMSEKRQTMSDEISAGMGVHAAQEGESEPSRPWVITRMRQIPDGSYVAMNSVRVVTDKDGVEYFVQSESEDGSLAAIDRQGNPHIISSADLVSGTMRDTGEMPLNDYLDRELTKRRLSEDEERVQSEFNRNRQNLLSRAAPGTPINLGTVETPKRGAIIAYQAGKFIVQDENGVVTEVSEEQMSHILDVPYNVETEEEAIDREVSDIERKEELRAKANAVKGVDVSSVLGLEGHGTLHSVSLDNDGNLIANIRIDEDNVITKPVSEDELASIIALGEQNSPAEVKEKTEAEVASENGNEVEEQPADDTPRDFHGNPLPMRTNKKGEQVVDETALWNNDPEAWCHYNDANPEQIVTSVEKLEYAAKELAKQATAAEKLMKKAALKGTTQDEIEDLRDAYKAKKDRLAVLQGILAEYKKPAEPAQTFAGEQRKAEASTAESAEGQVGEGGQTGSPVQSDAAGGEQVSETEVTPESNSESSEAESSVEGGEESSESEPENEGNQSQTESSAAQAKPSAPLTDAQKQVASELLGMSEAELEARSQELQEQKRQEPLKARAKEWEARTGVKVNAISSIDEVTNKQARKAIESGETVFGWFEPKTGTVCLYLPHVPNESEIDKTYIHEVVSHKGLRELLGEEGFNSLMDSVWNDMMSDADKADFLASVSHVKGAKLDKQRAAADEFVASYAENLDLSKPNSKWDKFVEAVRKILAKIGISLKVNEKDLSTLLQASLARYEKMQGERKANAPRRSARKTNKSAATRKPQELAVSSDVRDTIESLAKGLGYKIVWDDNIDSNGFWDSSSKTIHISRSAENPIEVVFGHEALHAISSLDGGIDSIRQLAIDIYGEKGFNDVVDTTERAYRKAGFDKDRSYYEEEALADFVGQMIGNQSMLDRICWDADHKILASIRDVIDKILAIIGMQDANMVRVRTTISAAYQRAIDNSNKPTSPQEERRFSLLRKKEVDQKSDKYYEEHKDAIPETVYAEAQASMDGIADMMLPYYDATALGNRMLPLEVYRNKDAKSTIFSNGAYGKTMENTLKCIRTLAYNKFTDDVKTELGRPLTQKESFLASQMVYDIATDPQCLYCYVSLDRKAYDEFLLRYVQQRDAILEKYRNLPVPERETKGAPHSVMASLYGDFLDGRKDTPVMQRRFDMWIDNERNGVKMITNADLATKDVRAAILNGMDESLAGQIKDAEKYAQSASWSKKDVDYISYVGELLKLSNTWIKRLTGEYGLRFYSFSEYTPAFLLENMQMVRDAALQGLNGLGYTKELDFVRVFAPTGMNINCSCYGRMGTDGTMVMDTNQGADWEEVKKLRQQYNNVGAVFVATNDKAVEWALSQDWIDIVIPFHIVRTGQDIADFYGWTNYSSQQADNVVGSARTMYISPVEHKNDKSEFLKACAKHGVTPRFSQWLDNPNYMKLVNETRLSVDETIPLQPIFDMSAAEDSWNRFVNRGGYYNGWWNIGAEDYAQAVRQVVEDIRSGKLASDVNYGRQDAPVLPAKMIAAARRKRMHGNTPLVDVFDRSGNVINKKDERAIDTNDSSDDVRFRRWYGGNSGYVGYSMSKRAAEARENGRFPKTDFMKEYGVSKRDFDELVNAGVIDNSEWHHTSKYGNKTTFYGWDIADYARIYTENKNDIKEFVEEIAKVRKSIVPSNEVNPYTYSNAQTALKDKLRVIDDSYYREMRKIPEWVSDEALDYYRANGWDAISEQEFHERMAELESEHEQNRKAAIAEASPEDRAIYEENERYHEFNSKKETPVEYERVDKTMKPYVEQLRDFFNSRVKEVEEDDNIIYRKRSEAAKVVATVNSSQKRAGTAYADALDMEDDILFRMSKNTRATVDNWVNKWGKAGGFDEETIEGTKSELNAQLDAIDDATTQLAFAKWFCSGRVRLGDEDMAKVEQAVKLARNHKVDPLSFSSPMEIINKWAAQAKEERIDPDTVSTLHKAKELSNGIVIYDVDESDESRENMRKIINTHFGKDCSPWCLLQGDGNGNLTEMSQRYWNHYNTYPKQVVFKDGKLLAFSANDIDERVFWDRQDVSHRGIPVISKIQDDKLGRSGTIEYDPNDGETILVVKNLHKGNKINGEYVEFFDDSDFERRVDHYKDGKLDGESIVRNHDGSISSKVHYKDGRRDGEAIWYYSSGEIDSVEHYKDGKLDGEKITYGPYSIVYSVEHYKDGKLDGESIEYYPDGGIKFVAHYKKGMPDGEFIEYYPDGKIESIKHYKKDMPDGEFIIYYPNGKRASVFHFKNGQSVGESIGYYEDGTVANQGYYEHGVWHEGSVEDVQDNSDTRFRKDFTASDIAKMETPILHSKGTFKNLEEAEKWAKDNLQGKEFTNQYTGENIRISGKSISEMLAEKFVKKTNAESHKAALRSVPDFIETGIPAEVHPDYHGKGYDVMRLYSAFEFEDELYRVKSTIKRLKEGDRYYTYELQEMELVEGTQASAVGLDGNPVPSSINSISGAKLLKGVKKTNSDELILPEDEDNTRFRKDQIPTKQFKDWFGDWEKAVRIGKLRNSADVSVEYNGEYALDPSSAQKWIKDNLRGEYPIDDTGEIVSITKVGAEEVTSHSRSEESHLKSIAAIPQMLKNAIFIEEVENTKNNGKYDSYRYYVVGLDIDGEKYTAKIVVGVKQGKKYYDHRLTQVEKTRLIDNINQPTSDFTTEGNESLPPYIGSKDRRLISILQTDSSKVVDESGEPLVVYHGSRSTKDFSVFDGTKSPHSRGTGRKEAYFFSNEDTAAVFASDVPQYEGEGRIVPAYLSIKNPARIDYEGALFSGTGYEAEYYDVLFDEWTPVSNNGNKYFPSENLAVAAIRHIIPHGELIEGENIRVTERKGVKPAIGEWIDGIDRDKYDGAIVENIGEMPTFVTTDYVAFRPNQIKSATENNGDFSKDNPDIRFRRHGMTAPMQGDDESDIDFTRRCIDRISYTYNMVADGISVTGVEVDRGGEYDPSTGKVTIFAKPKRSFFVYEDAYFHENLHAFIDKEYNGAKEEISEFYENARLNHPRGFDRCVSALRDLGYAEETLPEELFVYTASKRLANGTLASDMHFFTLGVRNIIEGYTNKIGYDINEEERLRSVVSGFSDRLHMRDSVREETPERRGGEESEGGSRSKAVGARGYTGDGVDWRSSSLYQREVLRETARGIGAPMELVQGTYESPAPGMVDASGRPIISRWNKGRVQICPNLCRDANDAACTYIHEAVGHSGLSSVFDQNQRRKLYLGIYNALPDAVRREVADKAVTRHGGSVVSAIEEFLSNDAIQEAKGNPISIIEDSVNPEEYRKSVWNVVRDGLTSAFGDKGLEVSLSLNDAKWLMAQSAFPNHESNPLEEVTRQVVANHLGFTRTQQAYKADGTDALRFRRKVDFQSDSAAEIYDRAVSDAWGRLKESYVDMYQSMEEGVKAIEQTTGRPAQAFENVLLALNQQSSKALATMQRWQSTKFAPMMTAIVDLANAISGKVEDVERYVMLKHGLERNEVFAKRDALDFYQRAHDEAVKTLEKSNLEDSEKAARIAAEDAKLDMHRQEIENGTDEKYLKLRKKDYSGLSGMYMEQGGNIQRNPSETDLEFTVRLMKARYPKFVDANGDIDLAAIENEASAEVDAIESAHSNLTNTLWGTINAATKATLQEQYEANLLSREQYARIRDMFKYYVPLRGFDDKTSEDFYSYYAGSSHSGYVNPIMHAEGRKSKAESPFGYIAAAESTAVAQGSKNMTKLALYYFVSNRANNDLLSVSDVWYKQVGVDQDDKPIYEAVYPNIPANTTRAEVEQAVSDFEDDMKRMAKAGLVFKGKNKLSLYGGTLRPSSSKMEHEHVIPFKLAGRDMMLIVHGNPRMAQAFTGALNYNAEEGIFTKICQEVLRLMASLNTQMNPEFWISNFQRDLLFSMMAVNVKEDKDYQRRYKNNLKHSIKNVIKYKKAYEKGALGNSYEENLYKQFVENGGVTGYTVMHDNAYWERRLKEFAGEERNVVSKVVNAFKGISDFGESFEQMARFAAFCTSVETGKDIREAIADAKNLTVNFNRKGSGKLISYEEAKKLRLNGKNVSKTGAFMIHLMSAMSPFGRRCVMFFNAAIQGLSTTWNLAKTNPAKMAGWSALFVLIGAANAALHAMLDDDDDYLDIPDFERRNNAMLGYNGAYLKWALPQEMRVFYGLGDMMVDHMLGRSPDKSLPVELLNAMGEVLPINPVEGILELDLPKIGKAMMPSAFTPILEIMVNEDYKGARVHNDYRYYSKEVARNIPKYRNPLPNTSKVFIGISEAANFLSGGDDVQAGRLNFDPNNIEHLFQGYTGGLGTAIGKGVHFVENAIQGEFAVRDTPFLRRLLVLNDERYRNSHTTDLYYYYKGEVENTKRILRDLKSGPDKIDRYMDFMESEEYEVMQIFDINEKLLEYYDEEIRSEEDKDKRRALMQEQDALRKEMILEISEIGKKD